MGTQTAGAEPLTALRILFWLGLGVALAGLVWLLFPTPGVDAAYAPRVRYPHFRRGPAVLIDEAHANTHTARGLYVPLGRLLTAAGYRVGRNRQPFAASALETTTVLIVANAGNLPAAERDAVRNWVREGGGLLLIAGRVAALEPMRAFARSYGVDLAVAPAQPPAPSGLLHPIRAGRADFDESADRLLLAPGPALLRTDPAAADVIPSRAAAIESDRGRVVVFTDADFFTARLVDGKPQGINSPHTGNAQLALNILLWLCHRI